MCGGDPVWAGENSCVRRATGIRVACIRSFGVSYIHASPLIHAHGFLTLTGENAKYRLGSGYWLLTLILH